MGMVDFPFNNDWANVWFFGFVAAYAGVFLLAATPPYGRAHEPSGLPLFVVQLVGGLFAALAWPIVALVACGIPVGWYLAAREERKRSRAALKAKQQALLRDQDEANGPS